MNTRLKPRKAQFGIGLMSKFGGMTPRDRSTKVTPNANPDSPLIQTAENDATASNNSAVEYPYQTWARVTGLPWSKAKELEYGGGNSADNIALQK